MKRVTVAAAVLLAACTWSNSLYQARHLSAEATRAERNAQPFQAQTLWGQVMVKAESAYARSPRGARGAEALWLAGHAAVHSRDCARAVPALSGALSAGGTHRRWSQQLLLELGICEETLGGPTASSIFGMLAASSTDPAVRHEAKLRQGHALVTQQDWQQALSVLAGEDTLPARLDRATALAALGRTDAALAELGPALAAADTSVRWADYLTAFAGRDSRATDSLLDGVLAMPALTTPQRNALLLAAAQAALAFDPVAADRRLRRLIAGSTGLVRQNALLMRYELQLTSAATPTALRGAVDSSREVDLSDGGFIARRIADRLRVAHTLLAVNDSVADGAPRGDLMMFALGELAQDSIGSPQLGGWFFDRLERGWPQSPYVAKAMLARAAIEPDSAAAITARARELTGSPYVAAGGGAVAGRAELPRLEDSLGQFIAGFWAARPRRPVATDRP